MNFTYSSMPNLSLHCCNSFCQNLTRGNRTSAYPVVTWHYCTMLMQTGAPRSDEVQRAPRIADYRDQCLLRKLFLYTTLLVFLPPPNVTLPRLQPTICNPTSSLGFLKTTTTKLEIITPSYILRLWCFYYECQLWF